MEKARIARCFVGVGWQVLVPTRKGPVCLGKGMDKTEAKKLRDSININATRRTTC